jgi:hypothetical protein
LVDRFEEYHQPIKQFFFYGKGLELQYLDSTIMASILERMTLHGHCGTAGSRQRDLSLPGMKASCTRQ